ncbi:MAG: hypothetical protein HN578_17295 [Rhodospirillales bacterium]|jgi:hypothetical protein|nr:hypothetical protein [Rhodospirillaceae bacterium]MBT7486715.1 hypothetical protein [Rhodospirillales bacterium]MBT8004668.1 hypothetical protein [Rhodospirillales bacterium]
MLRYSLLGEEIKSLGRSPCRGGWVGHTGIDLGTARRDLLGLAEDGMVGQPGVLIWHTPR